MKYTLYQITQQHTLFKMKKHWEVQTMNCDEQIKGEALGFQKLITMFIIFIIGILFAVSIFFCEILRGKQKLNQKLFEESVIIQNNEDIRKLNCIVQEMEKLSLNSKDTSALITIKIMKTVE